MMAKGSAFGLYLRGLWAGHNQEPTMGRRGQGQSAIKTSIRSAAKIVVLALPLLMLFTAAQAATPQPEPQTASVGIGGINLNDINEAPRTMCSSSVVVCGRQLDPLSVELGGGFTVKIDSYFRSSYECSIVNGQPTWVALTTEGSCEPVPVIMLPASYNEDEAWNVG
jgi:hypothetical protein